MDSGAEGRAAGRSTEGADRHPDRIARLVLFAPALLAVAGSGASALLAWALWEGERTDARMQLQLEAADRTDGVQRALEASLEQLHSTVALYASSREVLPVELDTFTARSFERHAPLRALFWVESPAGHPPFVVRLAVGAELARFPLGSDLASLPDVTAVLARARESTVPAVSAPLAARGTQPGARVLAAMHFLPDDGRAQGFVCALLDPAALLRAGADDARFALHIEDLGGASATTLAGTAGALTLLHTDELDAGGRRWRIACLDARVSAPAATTWRPWAALAFGLASTGLLAAFVSSATGRVRIQRLVQERTREVRQAYDTLALETKERLAAMAGTRRLERRLRAIIDLVPEQILVRDWLGRILLANRAAAEAHGTTVEELIMTRRRLRTDKEGSETLESERALMEAKRSAEVPEMRVVDAHGRRRTLHQSLIPCQVFGEEERALLCVATDVTEQKRIEEVLRVQNRLLADLGRGANPDKVLADTVLAAEALVPGMRCSVLLLAPDGQHLRLGHAPHLPDFYNRAVDGLEIGPDVGSCGAAAHRGERVIVEDVSTHPNWAGFREIAARAGLRACWSHPIRSSDGQVLGTFAMYYAEPRRPEPFEEGLIESLAHMAGIAIERTRMEASS